MSQVSDIFFLLIFEEFKFSFVSIKQKDKKVTLELVNTWDEFKLIQTDHDSIHIIVVVNYEFSS